MHNEPIGIDLAIKGCDFFGDNPSCQLVANSNFILSGPACVRTIVGLESILILGKRVTDAREKESPLSVYDPEVEGRSDRLGIRARGKGKPLYCGFDQSPLCHNSSDHDCQFPTWAETTTCFESLNRSWMDCPIKILIPIVLVFENDSRNEDRDGSPWAMETRPRMAESPLGPCRPR
ncbi:hypothetical protein CRG98_032768 [Punica granatum]|uniref:Uncharacterized protein n=1 Tax=Punica granatum TaxID=22663 RepID=A0A2I0IT72_PUNGR|nr:hypothetical protein CRG98_032768 [Punica granatum]